MDLSGADPNAFADAAIKMGKAFGWVFPVIICWWVFWKYNPWGKKD